MTTSLRGYRVLPGMALVSFLCVSWFHFFSLDTLHIFSQEKRMHHGLQLPEVLKRNKTQQPGDPMLPFKRISWVHIGKAGGNSFRPIFRAYCESDKKEIDDKCNEAPESMLSYRVKGFFHNDEIRSSSKSLLEESDAYLYNLRHPVDRMISWYHYEHPQSCDKHNKETRLACSTAKAIRQNPEGVTSLFFEQCFPTQDQLWLPFYRDGREVVGENCTDLAHKAIEGRIHDKGFTHISNNMRYYYSNTIEKYPSKGVLVVRTESLWDDLKDLDLKLGGYGSFGSLEGIKDSHGSEKYKKTNEPLSERGYTLLCCALRDEMHIYKRLIERSVNLDEVSKNATITSAANRCGFQTWDEMVDSCRPTDSERFGARQIPHSNTGSSYLPASPPLGYDNIMFVHVGKAAGNTLRVLFRVYCESDRHKIDKGCLDSPDSMLSDQMKGMMHSNFMLPKNEPHKRAHAYLFNLRNPVDRIMSDYHYEHPKSCLHNTATRIACHSAIKVEEAPRNETALFYQTCFPSQHYLPAAFNSTGTSVLQQTCNKLARRVFDGKAVEWRITYFKPLQGFKHISFNMRYYVNITIDQFPEKDVLVVRTESLWDDLKNLDIQLGGYGYFGQREGYKDSHGSEKYKQKTDTDSLSTGEYSLLCCALQDELDIYRDLLQRAANLNDEEKEFTILNTAKKCGFPSWNDMVRQCLIQQHVIASAQQANAAVVAATNNSDIMQSFDNDIVFVRVGRLPHDAVGVILKSFCEEHTDYFYGECPEGPDSELSRQVHGYYVNSEHPLPDDGPIRSTKAFLYNLAHPVDHLLAWYDFESPHSCRAGHEHRTSCKTAREIQEHPDGDAALFFQTCFPTVNVLPMAFKKDGLRQHKECTKLARRVMSGSDIQGVGFRHRSNNVRSFSKQTIGVYPKKKVLVVRSENLWHDLKDLDYQLGGSGAFGEFEPVSLNEMNAVAMPIHHHLERISTSDFGLLCCALKKELKEYRQLIRSAVNLDEVSKEETIQNAAKRCGFSSWDAMEQQCT